MRNSYNKFRYVIDENDESPTPMYLVAVGSLRSSIAEKRLKQGVFRNPMLYRARFQSASAFVVKSFANAME
ncbi:hypothetical protein [Paraburkholderia sp. BR14320]|uniref:hypothetical protein n=1 Tax=unclassified Paraburkholderia TaxID=2615204 RepID=UPI0034CF03EA